MEAKRNHFLFVKVLQTNSSTSRQNIRSQVPPVSCRLYPAHGRYDIAKRTLSFNHFLFRHKQHLFLFCSLHGNTMLFWLPTHTTHWIGSAPSACWIQTIPLGRVTFRNLAQSVNLVPMDTPKNSLQLVHLP